MLANMLWKFGSAPLVFGKIAWYNGIHYPSAMLKSEKAKHKI